MLDLFGCSIHRDLCRKVTDGAFDRLDFRLGKQTNSVVFLHLCPEGSKFIVKFCPVDQVMDISEVASNLFFPLHRIRASKP